MGGTKMAKQENTTKALQIKGLKLKKTKKQTKRNVQ